MHSALKLSWSCVTSGGGGGGGGGGGAKGSDGVGAKVVLEFGCNVGFVHSVASVKQ
jgi:hypothetical protein